MALDSGDWQCSPIHGIGFGRVATLANPRHWIREDGNRCQFPASVAAPKKSLPVPGNRCPALKTVAGLLRPAPEAGNGRRRLATAATLKKRSPLGAPLPGADVALVLL
jgi:hypothetical protein